MMIEVEVDADIDRYFGFLKGVPKPVEALLNGFQEVMVLILIILK